MRHPIASVCVQVWSGFWLNIKLDWSFLLTPTVVLLITTYYMESVEHFSCCRVEYSQRIAQCSPPFLSFYHATVFPIQHSPLLPSFFPKCRFHFHIHSESAGSLRVLMQQAEGREAILWSRSHNTVSHWTPEHLPLGLHQQPYKVHAWKSTEQLTARLYSCQILY